LHVPSEVEGVPQSALDQRATWTEPAAFDAQAAKLSGMFQENFKRYEQVGDDVKGAGPRG
jgi:phosphoenolpyruvate carboxykinase (ATP)